MSKGLGRGEVLPANDTHGVPGFEPRLIQHAHQAGRRFAWLPHQAETLAEPHIKRKPGRGGVDHAFVADKEHALPPWPQQKQRLLEPGIKPGQEEEVGAVFTVAVDGHPARAGAGDCFIAAARVLARIDGGRIRRG
jgi:hypothetical protein